MSDYNELLKTIDDALAQTDEAQEAKNPTQAILDEIDAALGEKPEAAPVPSVTPAPVPSVTPIPVESAVPAPVPSVTPQPEVAVTPAPVAAPQPSLTPSPVSQPVAELPKSTPSRLPEPTPPKESEVDYSLPSNQFLAMVKDVPDEKWGKDEVDFLNTLSGKDLSEIKKQRPDVIFDDILNQKIFDYQRETTPYKIPETKEDFYNLTKASATFLGKDLGVMASELVGDVLVGGAKAVKQGVPFLLGQTSDYAKGLEAEQLLSPEKQQEAQAWRKRAWEISNTPLKGGEQPNPDSYTDAKYLEKIKEGLTKEQIQALDQKYEQKRMEAKQVPFETLAPLADLPPSLAFLGTKLATGGFQTWDSISEQVGLLTKEQAYERWKTRELLDSVKAKMTYEEPRAWARAMDVYKPIYAPTFSYFASLSTPSVEEMMIMDPKLTKEEAESKRKATIEANVLDSIEETKKSIPETDPELQAFGDVAIPGGFGLDTFGYALNVVNAAKKLTPIARLKLKKLRYTDDEINALESKAQRVLKEKQLKELESKKTAGLVERAAGATAKGIEATGEYLERSPKFQAIARYTPYVAGAALGYEINPENPLQSLVVGGVTTKLGLKAAKFGAKTLLEAPKVIKEISAARRISAGGEMGPLATLESIAKQQDEVKNLTAKLKTLSEGTEEYIDTKKLLDDAKDKAKGIKEAGGEVVDYEGIGKVSDTTKKILRFASDDMISNIGEYAKMGIEPTILGLSMGMIDSSDEEELKGMIGSGLVFSLGGRAMQQGFHKFLGEDPVIAARKSRQTSMDALKAYRDSSPETQGEIDRLTDWTNVLQRQENKIGQAQSDLQGLQAEGASPDKIKKAEKVLSAEQKSLSLLKTANVQTRNEFGKNFLQQLARNNMLINGSLKAGQNNVGFHILSTQQIFDHFRKKPEYRDVSDEDLMMSATQQGFYSGTGGNEYRPGMQVSDAAKGLVFDTSKPSIVVNSDALQNRMMIFGETPTEALNHETGHHFARIPEIQNAMGDARKVLFTNEIKDASGAVKEISNGLYSEKQLNEMFVKDYLKNRPKDQVAEIAQSLGVWDYNTNSLNAKDVGSYMQEEILAELFSNTLSRNLGKNLDSKQLHLLDVARLKMKNNLLKNAVTKVLGLGASSDVVSELTNAKLPPEAQSAARNAVRLIQSMNGDFSTMASMPQAAPISRAEIKKSKIAAERYGMDSGLFATKVVAQVFDADGNPVGAAVDVNDPSVYEGSWRISKDGEERLSGYGQIPVQLRQLQVPEGGTLSIAKQVATEVDGVTPRLLNPKDLKKLQQDRASLFKQAIDTPDYGTPGRFEAVSEGSQTYRGSFTPMQIKAIQDLPEGIVPLKIKKYLLDLNEAIVKKDGTRFYVDYAAVMDDKGNYKAFSPKIYDVVPIGLHLSKDGNFLVTTISAGRMMEKLNLWSDRMPNRLNPWGGSKEAFWADFSKKYLDNWTKGIEGSGYDKQGQPIGTNQLDADVQAAEVKKSILNDFLNLFTNETQALNLDRTTIPKRKGDPKNKSLDRTIMSMRIDHMAELLDADHLPKLPIDYEKAKLNFMPAETERAKFLSAELEKMYEEGGTDKRIANYESELEGIYQKLESDQESASTEGEENITESEMNPQDVVFDAINNYKTGKVDNQEQTLAEHIRNVFDSEGKFNISPSVTDAEIESAANDIYNQKATQRQKISGLQFMPAEQPTKYEPISARIRPLEGISAPAKVVGAKGLSLGEIEPPVRGNAMLPDMELKPDSSEKGIQSSDITTSAKPAPDAVIKPFSNALVSSVGLINFLPAFHGTPFDVDKFKLANIGTGEGAQAYGWGLYFAQARKVAQDYKDKLTDWNSPGTYEWKGMSLRSDDYKNPIRHAISLVYHQGINQAKQIGKTLQKDSEKGEPYTVEQGGLEYSKKFNDALSQVKSKKEIKFEQGNLYKVDLDVKDEDLLDWDKPLSEQSDKIRENVLNESKLLGDLNREWNGNDLYKNLVDEYGGEKQASEYLNSIGIPGIRYLDGTSRNKGEGTYNYVVFDENLIKILDKNDKPVQDELPRATGLQFMPARPIGKTEPLPDFETTIIKGITPAKGFKWDKATNVEIDIGGGRKMSFSYDPEYLEVPKFKDLIKELKGQPVILLEADRQRATGGDMGGPLHPFLKSNQVTITGPDGKKYKAVWANMTSTFVSGAKNRLASHGAKYALVHLMDPIAHKSNKRTARTLDGMMRKSKLSQREKEIISLSMQAGIIAGEKSAMSSAITALKRQMSSAKKDPEKIRIINEKINKITKERENITPKGFYGEIFKAVSSIKKAISNVKTGNWAENSIEKANKKLEKYVNIKEYNELLKNNKSLYISDNIGNTFSDRGSAIGSILSFKFGKFDPSLVMRESSDFREGENLDIVTAVELSQNPDIFALYFGKDPKEEAAMSKAERKARDEMRANPDFVEHEAYDWVMLGPEKGNNFLVKNPVKPEQIFKKYRETHAGETVVDGSAETVAGAMRKNAGFILRVDEDTQKVLASKKKNK
jgi:hypothetical protein